MNRTERPTMTDRRVCVRSTSGSRRSRGGWRHGVGFPSCGWVTSSSGAFLPQTSERGSAERPGGAERKRLLFIGPQAHRRHRNVRVTAQRDGETVSTDSRLKMIREEAKVARRIAPSLSSGSLVSAGLLSEASDSTLLFIRTSKYSSIKASLPFLFSFFIIVQAVTTCRWGHVQELGRKPSPTPRKTMLMDA